MGFHRLLGNDQLKKNLTNALHSGHISHFYLISGPAGSGRHTLARLLAAAILCRGSESPCLSCNVCRKVMSDNHPDFITVDDPEKKTVPVDLIRDARADMYIQPNEADRKIYLFPRAHDMAEPSQNALLKILEEPPSYGVFILLTTNAEQLLPTVRSRCTELALAALPEELLINQLQKEYPQATQETLAAAAARSGGYLGQARTLLEQDDVLPPQTEEFLNSFANKNALELSKNLLSIEKWKRDQLVPILGSWIALLEEALACRSGMRCLHPITEVLASRRSSQELMHAVSCLQKAADYAQSNVSVAAVCGWLSWQLR